MSFLTMFFGCGEITKPATEWTQSRKIAGAEQKLSHISAVVVNDHFAYVVIGGTVADEQEGTNGLRKVALDSGTVTVLDDGTKNSPQSENGGIASDDQYVYWNAGGNIMRIAKSGGAPEAIVSGKVGIGIDLTVDDEKLYWANHGYYSANSPSKPKPIYMASKTGGKAEIFVDEQNAPGHVITDEKYVYWHTVNGIFKRAKSGGAQQTVLEGAEIGVDILVQDAGSLYFGFREKGGSRWALRKIPKQGGEPQTLVKTFSLSPFVVDDTTIYFFDEDRPYSLCKIPQNGGEVTRIDGGYTSGAIAQNKGHVYFSALDDILSISK